MRTSSVQPSDWRGVFPVPPLARRTDARRTIDWAQNDRLVRHMAAGGMTRFLYGGNAFLYHITLGEYEELLGWLNGLDNSYWASPSAASSSPGLAASACSYAALAPARSPRSIAS